MKKAKVSKNVLKRIELLREKKNYIEMLASNKIPVSKKLITEYKSDYKICKELLRNEMLKAPINSL